MNRYYRDTPKQYTIDFQSFIIINMDNCDDNNEFVSIFMTGKAQNLLKIIKSNRV